jgi:hypothetical protein
MNELSERIAAGLAQWAGRLRDAQLPGDLARRLERLADEVAAPCVLAVVGRVKAGKSTFVNALLGADLAAVGVTETTATINHFRYGDPPSPERPVRCHWRNGRVTDEARAFVAGLDGSDVEALRRADGIRHLEYFCRSPVLREVVIVDTPGLGAVVDEHQERTAEFLRLAGQLRQQNVAETERIGREADAILYLVGAAVRADDRAVLEEFGRASDGGCKPFNALGVLAKIDIQPAILANAPSLAARVAGHLRDSLNTVVPVSAGLERALALLAADDGARLDRLAAPLSRIAAEDLDLLLQSEDLFLDYAPDDCPVAPAERAELRAALPVPWGVFALVARAAADGARPPAAVLADLSERAGFALLRRTLDAHFFARGHILRAHRVLQDARGVLNDVRFRALPALTRTARADGERMERLLRFVAEAGGDPRTAAELADLVRERLDGRPRCAAVEALWRELDRSLAEVQREILDENADFEALLLLADGADSFAPDEVDELRALLGLYGLSLERRLPGRAASCEHVRDRQIAWRAAASTAREPLRRAVAARAEQRYARLLHDLAGGGSAPSGGR